jgi:glucose-6-phosphate 1-dehydrogenase
MTPPAENPLRAGLRLSRSSDPAILTIFGGTGDLTERKLMPALFTLFAERLLPSNFAIVGSARRPFNDQEYRDYLAEHVRQHARVEVVDAIWQSFAENLHYQQGEFKGDYSGLAARLKELDEQHQTGGNRLFYLATPPSFFAPIVECLGQAGLAGQHSEQRPGWARVIIEKPFGRDLQSAQQLNESITRVLTESQIYRIDHYLGKETVQNLLVFRFANGIWEPLWNNHYIEQVQITVAESVGLEGRASYYEEAGALRDMVQNHIMQLLALVAMEPPVNFEADAIRDEKVKALREVVTIDPANVVRGQYGPGTVSGKEVPGYREEEGAAPDSPTASYVALKLELDNWRWAGVPFYIRTGKRLPKKVTEIAICFKMPPTRFFADKLAAEKEEGASPTGHLQPNVLAIRVQPDEGITLNFMAKVPGPTLKVRSVNMDFGYGSSFGVATPEAYERLLLDAWLGDPTLFTRSDEVLTSWKLYTPILEHWAANKPEDFPNYEAGSWGPAAADELLARQGHEWHRA